MDVNQRERLSNITL